ncbi:hypothetical protein TNCV_4661221 [Trichonephila clavipes]|uniref:Uncharacterized protein n=1 Tax=Trichonephila clavipes TaxID=2585209 RepID=A0A8X6VK47_TRICX|nr:hypothetical protein TNCV_4661221 [Trichonephila clavipes]
MSNTANVVGVALTVAPSVVTAYTNLAYSHPETLGYNAVDNIQDECTLSEPGIHESYSTEVGCCEYPWQSSYSKTVSLGAECYEETTVVPRLSKLDTTAIRTSHLI